MTPAVEKDTIIVVYLPNKEQLISQFWGLYFSFSNKQLHQRFDFLVAGPAEVKHKIPNDYVTFVELEEISDYSSFRYVYSGGPYDYVNSFSPFIDQRCTSLIKQYKYALRIDVDTFLTPPILKLQINENEIVVGTAAYSSETARRKLPNMMKKWDLKDQNIHNVGSTWFCDARHMIKYGALTVGYVEYLLKNEFVSDEGSWPQWYAGVILLYAGHLAINSSSLDVTKTDKLDHYSTSDRSIDFPFSIHCWHTDDFFSKHWFVGGRYEDVKTNPDSLLCKDYSYYCASKGRELYRERQNLLKI